MSRKNNYEAQLALINGKNTNVSSSNDAKDFFVLVGSVIGIILIILMSFNVFADFLIGKMSSKTQVKIESLFDIDKNNYIPNEYVNHINNLEHIKQKIIEKDKSIQGKSELRLNVIKHDEINAMIAPSGNIYFTSKILDENLSEEELAFVLAHEIGHYSNKDHLKAISKQLFYLILFSLTGMDSEINALVEGVSQMEFLSHSREQEKKADVYANKMVIALYGSNEGSKNFIKKLRDKETVPEFAQYFSSHPSWNTRLELIENKQK